ncbi:MAG: TolC family protein, partial [Kingella sp. (in: b-proteobacteria)]
MHTPTKLLALIIPLALAACAVNTDVPSRVAVPPSFEQTSEQAGAIGQPENDLSRWWTTWQDPVLRDLVEQTLRENRNLAAAQATMQAAQAQADLAAADRRPQIGAGANLYATDKQDNPLPANLRPAAGSINSHLAQAEFDNANLRSAALSASWSPDIFGQKKSDA